MNQTGDENKGSLEYRKKVKSKEVLSIAQALIDTVMKETDDPMVAMAALKTAATAIENMVAAEGLRTALHNALNSSGDKF